MSAAAPRSLPGVAAAARIAALALLAACGRERPDAAAPAPSSGITAAGQSPPRGAAVPTGPFFKDVTAESGIAFRHEHGGCGRKYFVETIGSGAAWLDYDGDGDLDLYLVQGAALPGFAPGQPLHSVLLRHVHPGDAENGGSRGHEGGCRFVDVTDAAGAGNGGYGMAAAAADYDNDGDTDLFVSNFGCNVLYRNEGDSTFTEVATQAGVADVDRFHNSSAWTDFDGDGDLDLYVVNYVDFRLDDGKVCGEIARGEEYRSYCHPDMYEGIDDSLYRNDGDGTFTDVSEQAGLLGRKGKGLGICVADYDQDGDPDAFIANDADVNFLLRNDGGLRFTDVAPHYGVDFNGEGRTQSCMGAAFGDVDGDLDFDLFTVNLNNEYNTLWLLDRDLYRDRSYASGLASPSMPFVGFGTVMADFDGDGDLDVVIANGHVIDNAELVLGGTTYRQPAHLYWNDGSGRFKLARPEEAGAYFGELHVGRGLAAADFDDDGDLDLLFTNNGREEARLLRNERGNARSWIGLRLRGTRSNRDAIGTEVRVRTRAKTLVRMVRGAESYLCSHDLRVLVGLDDDEGPVDVEIRWPGGRREERRGLATRRYHRIEEAR
jgi:hypothetical protein